VKRHVRALAVVIALIMLPPSEVGAEILVFANGRTMSVKGYRISGDIVTVTLHHGGEASFGRSLIAEITPDEVPEPAAFDTMAGPAGLPTQAARGGGEPRPFAALIETVASRHGVDPALVHAVIQAESNYRPRARSEVGARGLMQVMPSTARALGVTSAGALFDPRQNVEAGVKYLKSLLERFGGDVPAALAAYNAGPGAVSRYDGIPPYPETQNYVRKVLSNFQQ
jgi:hypothetical protein